MTKNKFLKGIGSISLKYGKLTLVVKKKNGRFKVKTNFGSNPLIVRRLINSYIIGVSYEEYRDLQIKKAIKNLNK